MTSEISSRLPGLVEIPGRTDRHAPALDPANPISGKHDHTFNRRKMNDGIERITSMTQRQLAGT